MENEMKNLIVEGSVNTGKTLNVLFKEVEEKINNKENLFIFDCKEEYLNNFYDSLSANDYNTIIINLKDTSKSHCWNPLEYPYNLYKEGKLDDAQEELEKIAKIIFEDENSIDRFWTNSASDLFIGLTFFLFEDSKSDEINLNSVYNMVNYIDMPYKDSNYLEEYIKSKDKNSTSYIFTSNAILAPTETKGGIISVFRQKLRYYISRSELSYVLNKTTFNIDKSKPFAILFISKEENTLLNRLPVIFLNQLYSKLTNLGISCNFVLDNFDSLSDTLNIIDIMSTCLSRNIKTYIATRLIEEKIEPMKEYVKRLCSIKYLGDLDVKNIDTIIKSNDNIKYPKLDKKEIKLFSIEKNI